ncbi:bypass of stop codon protein 6 [Trichomonascus vanleenenianus]|uniref:bypass of stop codon protein 6 n=1 Tax=Trichomonascus vanleenenianus TaxID=2268995 RepID=UPI003EC9CA8B
MGSFEKKRPTDEVVVVESSLRGDDQLLEKQAAKEINNTENNDDDDRSLSVNDTGNLESQEEEEPKDSWRSSKKNIARVASTFYAFLMLGMNDATLGVLLPSIEAHYHLDYLVASVAFVAPFCGYFLVAIFNDFLHRWIGRWGVCAVGTTCHLIGFIICITAPPFPVYVIGYLIIGFGGGGIDGSMNAFVGSLHNANQLMGLLHASYGVGGILSPTIFQAMVAAGVKWNHCYAVLIGMGALNFIITFFAFYGDTGKVYRDTMKNDKDEKSSMRVVATNKVVWMMAVSLFLYVGSEVTIGGWTSTFMIDARGGNIDKMGYVTTGFWTGLAVGRVVLGYATEYFKHEEWCLLVYYIFGCAFLLVFWLVDHLVVSAVAIAIVGFWAGPVFPIIVVVAIKKLPKWLHVSGVGFAAALGGGGSAILPFVNGIISNHTGVKVLGPYAFSMFAGMTVLWMFLMWRTR